MHASTPRLYFFDQFFNMKCFKLRHQWTQARVARVMIAMATRNLIVFNFSFFVQNDKKYLMKFNSFDYRTNNF
jgi:hypothetical protein